MVAQTRSFLAPRMSLRKKHSVTLLSYCEPGGKGTGAYVVTPEPSGRGTGAYVASPLKKLHRQKKTRTRRPSARSKSIKATVGTKMASKKAIVGRLLKFPPFGSTITSSVPRASLPSRSPWYSSTAEQNSYNYGQESHGEKLDICFALDCTSSMSSTIQSCQKNIQDLVTKLRNSEGQDVRFSLIPYRDHGVSNGYCTKVYPFTRDLDQMLANVNAQCASGGGDYPEAVTAALFEGIIQDWRDDAAKLLVFMADAGPHGLGEGNEYPDGDPDGKCPLALAKEAQTLGVTVYSVLVGHTTKKSQWFFGALSYMTGGQAMELTNASALGEAVLEGARENIDMERSISMLRDRMTKLEKEKGAKLTPEERLAAASALSKVREIPSQKVLTVPPERIQQTMEAKDMHHLRHLYDGTCSSELASAASGKSIEDTSSRMKRAVEARDSRRTDKIMVECFQEKGKVRARIISDGYDHEKNCQFPRDIRKAGEKFVVDSVIDAGTFYRIRGEITPYVC